MFVVGYARSGTTLLSVMLGRHSKVAATPETHFFDKVLADPGRPREGTDHDRMVDHLLFHERARDLQLERAELLHRFRQGPATYRGLLENVLRLYGDVRGAERVVEKTPAHLAHGPRMLRWFPAARIVLMVRDGRDAVMSMMNASFTHDDLRRHCANWRRMAIVGERLVRRHPDQVLQIRFEDLVRDPGQVMQRVDGFLGLEFEPRQLGASGACAQVPEWEREWKERATGAIDPARVGAWRRQASQRQQRVLQVMMGRTLRWLGYNISDPIETAAATRLLENALGIVWISALHPLVRPTSARLWRLR